MYAAWHYQSSQLTSQLSIGWNHSSTGWYYTGNVSVYRPALVIVPYNAEPHHRNYSE